MIWQCGPHRFEATARQPLLLGILNITPDSFHDGGRYAHLDAALRRTEELLSEGADLIDIGGESTRPGALPIGSDEEKRRVIPVIEAIHARWPETPISIDTYQADVAQAALDAGACVVNDIGAGRWSEGMIELVASSNCGYIAMHSLDRPQTMQNHPAYHDVVEEVGDFLSEKLGVLETHGVQRERVVLDPGIGFGKRLEDNLALIAHAQALTQKLARPTAWGLSHKSWISRLLGVAADERLVGTLAGLSWLLSQNQPMIWRIHDVKEAKQLIQVWQALKMLSSS